MTVTKEQALNAIHYLEALGDDAIGRQRSDINLTNEYVSRNAHMLASSIEVLKKLADQCLTEGRPEPTIAIVYEYKLRRADGKLMNKSNWDKKGKTYKNRAALAVAIGTWIGDAIDKHPDHPTYNKFTTESIVDGKIVKVYDQEGYKAAYRKWWTMREDKNIRALYIPADWTVLCIPVNTKADIVEINAIDWYKGAKP